MPVHAELCPNCGAPMGARLDRCEFCDVRLTVTAADGSALPPPPPAATAPPSFASAGGPDAAFSMLVDDVFAIAQRGTVATGRIDAGTIRVGDQVVIDGPAGTYQAECTGVEMFRKKLDTASAGDNVGLLLKGIDKDHIAAGARLRGVS